MSTRTPATEGQAKIRQLLTDLRYGHFDSDAIGAINSMLDQALAILDASPPIVGELTEEEIKRIAEHESEFAQHFADGLRYARDHGYLAQAPQSSPAAQGVMVDQILEVVNDWRANMHLIEVPPNTPYSTGVQNVLRSRLSALLTKPKAGERRAKNERMFTESEVKVILEDAIAGCAETVYAASGPFYIKRAAAKGGIVIDPT